MRQALVLGLLSVLAYQPTHAQASANSSRTFKILNDRFVKDGQPYQLISGRSDPIASAFWLSLRECAFSADGLTIWQGYILPLCRLTLWCPLWSLASTIFAYILLSGVHPASGVLLVTYKVPSMIKKLQKLNMRLAQGGPAAAP